MWPITKPKRISPVTAITTLRPRDDRRKACACAGVIELLSPPGCRPAFLILSGAGDGRERGDGAGGSGAGGGVREGARGAARDGPQELAEEHALEGRLLVDAVVVGAADEAASHLRVAGPGFGLVLGDEVRAEHGGPGHPAVAGLEHRLRLLA